MRTLLKWLLDDRWGDDMHVPADRCPWREHGHLTRVWSHRPPWRPWRRVYELRCYSCTLVVPLPRIRRRYDSIRRRAGGRHLVRRRGPAR